jgi:hypothetical protein
MSQEWYRKFVSDMDRDVILEILVAANYMNIPPLLNLACPWVTFELEGKTAEEVNCQGKLFWLVENAVHDSLCFYIFL